MTKLLAWVKADSAIILYGVQAALALLVAFGLHLSPGWTGAIVTIVSALITIATALATRPVQVPVITGAVVTMTAAAAAFGLHLSSGQISAGVAVLSVVLAHELRQNVSPAVRAPAVIPPHP